jgi:hypothetical protein
MKNDYKKENWKQFTPKACRTAGIVQSFSDITLRVGRPKSQRSIPRRGKKLFLLHNVQTGSGAHLPSKTINIGENFSATRN